MRKPQPSVASTEQKILRRSDLWLIAVVAVVALVGLLLWKGNQTAGTSVAVFIDGVQTATYPLTAEREVVIATGDENQHRNVLVIKDGKAYIREADCPDSICVKTRAAAYVGETIVCLPHKLVVEIVAESSDSDLDMTV